MIIYDCPKCRRTDCWPDDTGIKSGEPCPRCKTAEYGELLARALKEAKASGETHSERLRRQRREQNKRLFLVAFFCWSLGIAFFLTIRWITYG